MENTIPSPVQIDAPVEAPKEVITIDPDEINRIIQQLPNESDRRVIEAVVTERMFQGPLPPPEFLAAYKQVLPDAPERIMAMAEREQQHRHNSDDKMIKGAISQRSTGQVLGFILALLFGVASVILGLNGQTWLAGILGTSTVIGLAVIFVLNQQPRKNGSEDSEDRPKNGSFDPE